VWDQSKKSFTNCEFLSYFIIISTFPRTTPMASSFPYSLLSAHANLLMVFDCFHILAASWKSLVAIGNTTFMSYHDVSVFLTSRLLNVLWMPRRQKNVFWTPERCLYRLCWKFELIFLKYLLFWLCNKGYS